MDATVCLLATKQIEQRITQLDQQMQLKHDLDDDLGFCLEKPKSLMNCYIQFVGLLTKTATLCKKICTTQVNAIAFSPDGKLLASNSKTARLWNIPNGNLHAQLEGDKSSVYALAFSPDGKSIVTASYDKCVRTWSVETKQQLQTFTGHSNFISSVAWSPNGNLIASCSTDQTVILWDVISGSAKKILKGLMRDVYSVSFSPNGSKLAVGGTLLTHGGIAMIWDVNSGAVLVNLAHNGLVRCVCFSTDEVIFTGCDDGFVRMFNANTGLEQKRFKGHVYILSVAVSPDGSVIAAGSSDFSVLLWDVASTRRLQEMEDHYGKVYSVAFSPDGKYLASGSWDKTIRLWNTTPLLQNRMQKLQQQQQQEEQQQQDVEDRHSRKRPFEE